MLVLGFSGFSDYEHEDDDEKEPNPAFPHTASGSPMIALAKALIAWLAPHTRLRRYRVTPRRNPRVFRRELLAGVLCALKHDTDG